MPFVAPRIATLITLPSEQTHGLRAPDAAVGIPAAPDAKKLVETRLHRAEVFRTRQGILRQIDSAAFTDYEFVHRIDQRLRLRAHGNVEGDRRARHRKRQETPALGAAVLDHAK